MWLLFGGLQEPNNWLRAWLRMVRVVPQPGILRRVCDYEIRRRFDPKLRHFRVRVQGQSVLRP